MARSYLPPSFELVDAQGDAAMHKGCLGMPFHELDKYKSYLARVGDGKLDLSMSEVAMDLVHV